MGFLHKILLLFPLSILLSCQVSKNTNINKVSNLSESQDKPMIEKGYKLGILKKYNSGECFYIIEDELSKTLYDPVNLNEDIYKEFLADNLVVFYKFIALRRQNRCNAQPIKLIDLKKREAN